MGFMFARKKSSQTPMEYTGLQTQTAVQALPIPLIYGTPRVPVNIIYANNFTKTKVGGGGKGGGKGLLGGGKGGGTQYSYRCDLILAIGEGPLGGTEGVPIAWFVDQNAYGIDGPQSPYNTLATFDGTQGQAPWSYLTDNFPQYALGYTHTAYLANGQVQLDSSATAPQWNICILGLFSGTFPFYPWTTGYGYPNAGGPYFTEADPAKVIYDFLTNVYYGVGFPANLIDPSLFTTSFGYEASQGDDSFQTYCGAIGLGFSLVLNSAEQASSILDRWLKLLVVAPVWTGETLKFIPYWDTFIDGAATGGFDASLGIGPYYFRPNVTTLFDLDDSDFIQSSKDEDPVTIDRTDPIDVMNTVMLDFKDRYNYFNDNMAIAVDEVYADLYSNRVQTESASEFTELQYAALSAQLILQRNIAIRNHVTFKLSWEYSILEPMDIVTITDANLGLSKYPVRIVSIEEDDVGILTITAEEFPLGAATTTAYPKQATTPPTGLQTNQAPDQVNPPVIFEPTAQLLQALGQSSMVIAMAVSGGTGTAFDPNWGGCNVLISSDNVTYVQFLTIEGPSRQGLLSANLPAYTGSNPDNTDTLQVNLAMSDGELQGTTPAGAAANDTLCAIVDTNGNIEFLSYTTATLVTGNTYNLTGLYRGLFGTDACAHLTGSQFCRVDSLIHYETLPPQYVDTELWFKFQSFNVFNQADLAVNTLTAYTYTPTGAGVNPGNNAVLSGLLAGNSEDWGLLGSSVTGSLDLNAGGGPGPCTPILYEINLGIIP